MTRVQTSRTGEWKVSGFTLLELIIVLVLLGVVSVLVAPSFTAGFSGLQLETSTRDVITVMKHARSEAIGKQRVFRVVLGEEDETSGKYFISNDFGESIKEFQLPDGFRFELGERAEFPMTVSFYPNGRSSGGEFALRSPKQAQLPVVVDAITGLAKVRKETQERR